jgi:membrane fusion protein (multidrug efflux system)
VTLLDETKPAEAERLSPPLPAPPPEPRPPASPRRFKWLRYGLALLAAVALAVGATAWWLEARHWVSTDDAFIDAHMVSVSPQVAGRVVRVLVTDNEAVHVRQPLVEIDPAAFRDRLDQALANRAAAAGKLAQAKAQQQLSEANLDELRAEVGVAEATAANAAIDMHRDQELARIHSAALSQQQLDNAIAAAKSSAANLEAAKRKVASAAAQVELSRSGVKTAQADLQAAAAQVEQTRLDLSYTEITAPEAGHISHKSVAVGDYIQTGQDLMALVPDQVWVTANFKETDLDHMRPGQRVDIDIDAYPDRTFHGRVDSIQAGSGAAFALLPPENATGNYVKVVQRVPVKIVFDGPADTRPLLGPGMSVVPYVRIR